jgi:hypothetical protein
MTFKELKPEFWTYENKGDSIEGVLVQKQEHIGANDSNLYSLETEKGIKNVWGATVLDNLLSLVQVGSKIRITYEGVAADKKGGKNPAKLFKIEVDDEQ